MPYIIPHDVTSRATASSSSLFSHMFPSHEHAWLPSDASTPATNFSPAAARPGRSTSLKSCLKPQPPSQHLQGAPRRSKSAPKLVHYPSQEGNLRSVREYKLRAKPRTISRPEEETETETEGYDSSTAPSKAVVLYALDAAQSSLVPAQGPASDANVYLETVQLPAQNPPALHCSVIVRNIAFDKSVRARFTFDGWMTASEVEASYANSMPTIPPPFHDTSFSAWDRFVFRINLADRVLNGRTLSLAVRYRAVGGEWWDNNGEQNYSFVFVASTPSLARDAILKTRWLEDSAQSIPRSSSPLSIDHSCPDEAVPRHPFTVRLASASASKPHRWTNSAQHLAAMIHGSQYFMPSVKDGRSIDVSSSFFSKPLSAP